DQGVDRLLLHLRIRVSKSSDIRFDGTEVIPQEDRGGAPNDQDDHRGGQGSTTGSLHGLLLARQASNRSGPGVDSAPHQVEVNSNSHASAERAKSPGRDPFSAPGLGIVHFREDFATFSPELHINAHDLLPANDRTPPLLPNQ